MTGILQTRVLVQASTFASAAKVKTGTGRRHALGSCVLEDGDERRDKSGVRRWDVLGGDHHQNSGKVTRHRIIALLIIPLWSA